LCHTGIRGLRRKLVFLDRRLGAISHVLYSWSECLKENDVSRTKSHETSKRSEEVKLEVDKFELEGEEVKLRGASNKGE
jgi:hypothetical protein